MLASLDHSLLATVTGGEGLKEPLNTKWSFRGEHLIGKGQDLLESHGAPGKFIDVKGFPAGSTVADPYTAQVFRIPARRNVSGRR
jgi:hypothetical protein